MRGGEGKGERKGGRGKKLKGRNRIGLQDGPKSPTCYKIIINHFHGLSACNLQYCTHKSQIFFMALSTGFDCCWKSARNEATLKTTSSCSFICLFDLTHIYFDQLKALYIRTQCVHLLFSPQQQCCEVDWPWEKVIDPESASRLSCLKETQNSQSPSLYLTTTPTLALDVCLMFLFQLIFIHPPEQESNLVEHLKCIHLVSPHLKLPLWC